ncbi:neprilysin-like, partial [Ruditapes philippinarum]|uniref:neprilysin-like n=1 Tax=Ruditapes philippinarum TaxID=129788 RepID=UPI00295B6957
LQYDKDGANQRLWSKEDMNEFSKRAQCFVDTISNITVPGTGGMKTNGERTLAETLADHEGLKTSYMAYMQWLKTNRTGKDEKRLPGLQYSPKQLFFLNSAIDQCSKLRRKKRISLVRYSNYPVESIRINFQMQNSKEFAEAWNCPVGSFMNPGDKCNLY